MAGVEVEGDMVICVIRQGSDGARSLRRRTLLGTFKHP